MGLLQFANLGLTTRFDTAQRSVFNGLGDLYRYLNAVKRHLERTEAVRRIEWTRAEPPEWAKPPPGDDERGAPPGVWVRLVDRERGGSPEQLEEIRTAFLDEGTREVYERSPLLPHEIGPDEEEDDDAARARRSTAATGSRCASRCARCRTRASEGALCTATDESAQPLVCVLGGAGSATERSTGMMQAPGRTCGPRPGFHFTPRRTRRR